jgi:hypothetical protein
MNSPIILRNDRIIRLLLSVTNASLGNIPTAPGKKISLQQQVCAMKEDQPTYGKNIRTEIFGPRIVMFQAIYPERKVCQVDHDEPQIEAI